MKNKTKLLLRDAFFSTILSGLLVSLLVLVFFNLRFFNPIHKALEGFSFLDVFYSEKFLDTSKKSTDIILVNAGEDRIDFLNTLQQVIQAQPRVIGVDVMFDSLQDVYIDSTLAELLRNPLVVNSMNIVNGEVIKNEDYFQNDNPVGFVNFNFDDRSTVVREFEGITTIDGQEQWSFAAQVARKYLDDTWPDYEYDNRLKRAHTINFKGNHEAFICLEMDDFRAYEKKELLKDKIVILGYLGDPLGSEYDIQDKFFTPLNKYFAGRSDADMFGSAIHANIVNMLINDDFMITISNFWLIVITFFAMYFSTMYYMKINRKYKISFRTRKRIFQFLVSTLILFISFWLFKNNVVLKPTVIIVGIILAGSYFKYYKHLTRYIKTKTQKKWKTYLK